MIDRSTIERVMAAADIVDVVGEFVTLRRAGANFKGLCPFHNEKTPSFMVSPAKQLCKCFSCGNGGNVVKFIQLHEQLTYPEAIKWLGRRYGIEVREREQSDEERMAASDREAMFVLNEWAKDYFVDVLHNNVDGVAIGMQYFRKRGLRDDIIQKFQLGYAPEQRDALAAEALRKGFENKFLESTGLCFRTDDGRLLDRYHGRVIFPVHTISGRVVAFGGRILNTENKKVGKYVNSPESQIYSKKRELYGLYFAKQAIVRQDRCFLVEGYLDVISMAQSGIENVVASSCTSLTNEQVRLIHRFTENVTVLYDGDAAGIHASLRGIDMLLAEGLNIKVLLLPDGEDPDSFAQQHSAAEFQKFIDEQQTDFIRFKTDLLMKEAGSDPTKRAGVVRDIVRSISMIPSDITRRMYVHELAVRLGMDESVIVGEVGADIRRQRDETYKVAERQHATSTRPPGHEIEQTHAGGIGARVLPVVEGERERENQREQNLSMINARTFEPGSGVQRHFVACERELLEMVLRYGECPVIVPPDPVVRRIGASDHKDNQASAVESPLVAPYILSELQADDLQLQSPHFQQILEETAQHAGEEGFRAREYFLLHSDPEVSQLADRLTHELYELSSAQLQQYVPEEKRLVEILPRVINDYKHAILLLQKEEVLSLLRDPTVLKDSERVDELMHRLMEINRLETVFAKILGDRVLTK